MLKEMTQLLKSLKSKGAVQKFSLNDIAEVNSCIHECKLDAKMLMRLINDNLETVTTDRLAQSLDVPKQLVRRVRSVMLVETLKTLGTNNLRRNIEKNMEKLSKTKQDR